MAASKWEKDFCDAAIQASLGLIGKDVRDAPFDYPFSFCLPISNKPISGISPDKISLVALMLGFACLLAAAMLASAGEKAENVGEPRSAAILVAACAIGLSGFGCFFAPFLLQRRGVSQRVI